MGRPLGTVLGPLAGAGPERGAPTLPPRRQPRLYLTRGGPWHAHASTSVEKQMPITGGNSPTSIYYVCQMLQCAILTCA